MKQLFTALVMNILKLCGVVVFVAACSENVSHKDVRGDVQVEVPWSVGVQNAKLKTIELEGLDSLESLNGRYAQFEIHPQSRGSTIVGMNLKASFIKVGEQFIPRDVLTGQMAAVYAHFQKLFYLDQLLGVENLNQWPRKIAVVTSPTSRDRNNAFYDGKSDFFVFVPYTKEQIPLMVNGGVLAHEHFHSLFFKLVMIPLKKAQLNPFDFSHGEGVTTEEERAPEIEILPSPTQRGQGSELSGHERKVYEAIKLRALNEGLADYWGYLYSQDANFLKKSLPDFGEQRSLRGPKGKAQQSEYLPSLIYQLMTKGTRFKGKFRSVAINSEAYFLATRHSRLLYDLTELLQQEGKMTQLEAQLEIAKAILSVLPDYTASSMESQKQSQPSTVFDFFLLLSQHELIQKHLPLCQKIRGVLEIDQVTVVCEGLGEGS